MAIFPLTLLTCALWGGVVDLPQQARSLLAANCDACHGRDGASRAASLRLDTFEDATAERRRGRAIVPGDPDASLVIQRITTSNSDERMPPGDHVPLSPDEVDLLRTWIEQGATYTPHWAWEPLQPGVGSIDDQLTDALPDGLHPAPPADATTWIRRLHFDLTGLPPDPSLVDALTANDTPAYRAGIVDALLAREAFGEHWSRHWLDAFGYAETCGHEFDYPLHGAWRFRDWLVEALNADLPWARVTSELIAGDLIEPRQDAQTSVNVAPVGTGVWAMHQAVHAPVDVLRDEDDHRSDQLDILGRGLLGVTISCARCHDHKFDPISARDYQGLANMFRSSRRVFAGVDQSAAVADEIAALAATRAAVGKDVDTMRAWITAAGAMGGGRPTDADAPVVLDAPHEPVMNDFESGHDWHMDGHAFGHAPAGTWWPRHDGPGITQRGSLHSGLLGEALAGTAASPEFTIDADYVYWRVKGRGVVRVIVDDYIMDAFNALLFEGHKHNVNSDTWVTISHPVAKYLGHRAYLLAIDEGPGVLEVDTVACDYTPPWAEPRTNRNARGLPLMQWRLGQVDDEPLLASSNGLLEAAAALPPPVTVVRYQDASVVEQPVWNRGDPSQPGEAAPRHVPALLGGDDANRPGPGESGRLQLAQAVTHPDNPLLWRTAANRVWHHLMGAGFTDQLDDLGAMGTPPTHPVLLDTLARQLADGGSIKELVRTIVLSNAYARSSHRTERSDELDPLNRSFHRANVRRLSGEQLRDAMLVASESLDDTTGGPPVPLHLSESMTGRGRPGRSGPRDGAGRRSLYIEVRRNFADPMFAAFDRPTPNRPCGARTVSNVPAQSLTLMNDPFVHEQAGRIARYALQQDAPVHLLAMRLWGRPFTDEEVSLYTPATIDESSLTTLAHAMICAKAFTFLP